MSKRVVWILVGVSLAVLAVPVGVSVYALRRIHARIDGTHAEFEAFLERSRAAFARAHPRFMQDQARLARLPIFAPRAGTRDAGPVIAPRLFWDTREGYVPPTDPAVPRDLVTRLHPPVHGSDGIYAPPVDPQYLDLRWMAELHDCDLWDVDRGLPGADAGEGAEPFAKGLLVWAELRIQQGVYQEDVPGALAEIEDLARLCFTTERRTIEETGIELLALVVSRRRAQDAGGSPSDLRYDDIEALRWLVSASRAYASLETPAEYEGDLGRFTLGRCTAIRAGLELAHPLRPALEESMAKDYRRLDRILAAHPECRLGALRARWAQAPDPRAVPHDVNTALDQALPAARQAAAESRLMFESNVQWLGTYP